MTPLLSIRDLAWMAPNGVEILQRTTLDVAPHEFVAVLGRNGAGKSTLIDMMAGLRRPSAGHVLLAGRSLDAWHPRQRARLVAHLPQALRADVALRVEALVLMGRYPHAGSWFESDDDRRIAHEAMTRCECLALRDRTVASLSGGERQRVYLAACLAQQARLLLLDEPATFLDLDQQLHCFERVREHADRGAACMAVTHDVNLALAFCTRLIVLVDGVIAHDVPRALALDDPSWLRALSPRLALARGADGAPSIRYQLC